MLRSLPPKLSSYRIADSVSTATRPTSYFHSELESTKRKFLFCVMYYLFGVHTNEAIEFRERENGKKNIHFQNSNPWSQQFNCYFQM